MVEGLVRDGPASLGQILDDGPVLFHLSVPLLQDHLLQLVSRGPCSLAALCFCCWIRDEFVWWIFLLHYLTQKSFEFGRHSVKCRWRWSSTLREIFFDSSYASVRKWALYSFWIVVAFLVSALLLSSCMNVNPLPFSQLSYPPLYKVGVFSYSPKSLLVKASKVEALLRPRTNIPHQGRHGKAHTHKLFSM